MISYLYYQQTSNHWKTDLIIYNNSISVHFYKELLNQTNELPLTRETVKTLPEENTLQPFISADFCSKFLEKDPTVERFCSLAPRAQKTLSRINIGNIEPNPNLNLNLADFESDDGFNSAGQRVVLNGKQARNLNQAPESTWIKEKPLIKLVAG